MEQPTKHKQEQPKTDKQQQPNNFVRKTAKMSQQHKEKIRQAILRFNQHHPRTEEHNQAISQSCKAYWDTIKKNDETSIEDLI